MKLFQNKFRQHFPYLFISGWSLLILANFVPAIPQPDVIIGYLWKVEFALAAFLSVSIILLLKSSDKKFVRFNRREFVWIILPLLLFTIWSGFSVIWAESARAAIHYTLLWACYLIFYLLIRQIAAKPQFLDISLKVSGVIIAILGILCLTEYLTTSAEMSVNVSLRYAKYAEAIAALFLIFAAFAVGSRNRHSILSGAIALLGWLAIVFSLGRTQFLAALCGIFVFAVFVLIKFRRGVSPKKALIFTSLFILITAFSQIAFTGNSNQTTLKRLSGDEHSRTSFQVRFLFWQIALESFKQNPFHGTGAENFASNYKNARENFATQNPSNENLAFYEELLPERAHNEFLQIPVELGVVGTIFFGWLLFGILRIAFLMRKGKISLLSIAAFAGICAFLVSSMASSYSFRVPANGLCFFFVLAIFVSRKRKAESEKLEKNHFPLSTFYFPLFAGLTICAAMLVFSAVRGASLMNLQFALTSETDAESEVYLQKAIALDNQDPMLRYYYGLHLYNSAQPDRAIPEIRFSINKGIATSISYFNLAAAQIVAEKYSEAEQTLAEGIRVYPRSVFLITAFASLLEENGKTSEAQDEYKKALQINAKQARSWRLAFVEGMNNLTQAENRDKQFVKAMELRPTDAIYALLDFQHKFRPNLVRR